MTAKRMEFRVRQFVLGKDRFEDLLKLDEKILKDERNRLNVTNAKEWCKINPNIFYILEDRSRNIHGYMGVVPIRHSLVETMLIEKEKRGIFPLILTKEYVLSPGEAKKISQKDGNSLYGTCHVCQPETGKVDYYFASLLFLHMEALYYKYRMRCIVGVTRTNAGKALWEDGGCVRKYDMEETKDGITSVYYFDNDLAMKRPASGLGVIMTHIWGVKGYKMQSLINLTDKQKEVLRFEFSGYTRKETAEHLGIDVNTIEGRMKAIDAKGRAVGFNDRRKIKAYFFQNYWALM